LLNPSFLILEICRGSTNTLWKEFSKLIKKPGVWNLDRTLKFLKQSSFEKLGIKSHYPNPPTKTSHWILKSLPLCEAQTIVWVIHWKMGFKIFVQQQAPDSGIFALVSQETKKLIDHWFWYQPNTPSNLHHARNFKHKNCEENWSSYLEETKQEL
jgi:hypothetical protein